MWSQKDGPLTRDLRSFEIRFEFESAVPTRFESDGPIRKFSNWPYARTCPLLIVIKRLKPLTALSGTLYRLANSMSDHTPVLFNVFELRTGMRNL